MNDTIVGIATALGVGAVSIIRVSGDEAIKIVNGITLSKKLNNVNSHTINYDYIVDNNEKIDEVLISVMLGPKSFTREDVVEINAHGGIATTKKILELLLIKGCRLSEPGEFTKRAYLNGRIDLTQAEGIMDLINAKTDKARDLAINQLGGNVSRLIKDLRQYLLEILANIEVNIDYPEYEDIEEMTIIKIKERISLIEKKINSIIKESENSKIIKEGIKTVIIGKPNVGKSSLLNCLIDEEKAIVTDIEGTTRDVIEGSITIDGIALDIMDTAGIRSTEDLIEKIGVQKSLDLIDQADLILFVLNNNDIVNEEEMILLEKIYEKKHILVINKLDLESNLNQDALKSDNIVKISTLKNQGILDLKNKIKEMYNLDQIETKDINYLTNARSLALLNQALEAIQSVKVGIEKELPIDMIEIDIKSIWNLLGEITGEKYQDDLINQLFSQFCLGK